ncbi:hypothetical protein [Candidatus Vidania fulgoroideorum]
MGNKINPNYYRFSINNNWYIKNSSLNYISIYESIKKYLNKNIGSYNYEEFYLEKLEKYLILNIYNLNKIYYIKKNNLIKKLKNYLFKKFKINSYINIKKSIYFQNFSFLFSNLFIKILNRENHKTFIKNYFKNSLNNLLKGIKILISGRINGSDIARKEIFKTGLMPLQTCSKKIFYKSNFTITKYGSLNIKIWLYYEF